MTASSRYLLGCLFAFSTLFLAGCSDGLSPPPNLPSTVKVTGTATLDGKPLEGAVIRFAPISDKGFHGASGVTDASGKYELVTDIGNGQSRPGVIPGEYTIHVSRMVKPDGSLVPANSKEPPMMLGARDTIPLKYVTGKVNFRYTVAPEGGSFDLKLDSKE
ncbi:MAG: carboxypeptidase regulatory-like domain-containing protein [Planctomycetes bacterium]|nr:carboxypeptidase regulatory-like domain-containing protein [Planctomycetota bacterium]